MSLSTAGRFGFRKAISFNIGVFFGFFIIITLCSVFSMTLYRLIPSIKPIMTIIGAMYIVWLAWRTYRNEHEPQSTVNDQSCIDREQSSIDRGRNSIGNGRNNTGTILTGFLLQFVNVKVILYGITAVSTFIVPYYKSALALAFFSLLLASVAFVSTCCWSLCGTLFQKLLAKNNKAVSIIMALLLLYCAVSLFL